MCNVGCGGSTILPTGACAGQHHATDPMFLVLLDLRLHDHDRPIQDLLLSTLSFRDPPPVLLDLAVVPVEHSDLHDLDGAHDEHVEGNSDDVLGTSLQQRVHWTTNSCRQRDHTPVE